MKPIIKKTLKEESSKRIPKDNWVVMGIEKLFKSVYQPFETEFSLPHDHETPHEVIIDYYIKDVKLWTDNTQDFFEGTIYLGINSLKVTDQAGNSEFNYNYWDIPEWVWDDLSDEMITEINKFIPKFFDIDTGFTIDIDIPDSWEGVNETFKMENNSLLILKKLNESLVTEASKKKILMNKVGFNEKNAELLDELCGPLSVWMGNKLINYYKNYFGTLTDELTPQELKNVTIDKVNDGNLVEARKSQITTIMDWIRVGLNGNLGENKQLEFPVLLSKAGEWHESLEVGQGDINYVEENPIIIDYRDDDGNGFYWIDLQTNNSSEECDRMGHCGRTSIGNTLYSLRESKPLGNKYTLNKSHLTASIGNDGILYQLKGPKNSKPKEEFHKYILPLFYVLGDNGEEDDYLIQGFGSEYENQLDFKITDLPKESIIDLYKNRPELFDSVSMKYKLYDVGIIDEDPIDWSIRLNILPDELDNFIEGDWVVNRWQDKNGHTRTTTMFETILSGDAWELWDNYDADWESSLFYNVDDDNKGKIHDLLIQLAKKEDMNVDGMDLKEMILELDGDYEIRNAISFATSDAESDDYVNYLYGELKSAAEELGDVKQMNDEGVTINIDVQQFLSLDDEYVLGLLDDVGGDAKHLFEEMIASGIIHLPKFNPDSRYYPDINDKYFNDMLNDRLSEIQI